MQTGRVPPDDERPSFDEDPKQHARLKRIFLKAIALPEEERQLFLGEACEGEPRLRREVESLLHFHFAPVETRGLPPEPDD